MSQLPDAFQGHDLTGWTLVGNAYVARFTNHGYTIELSSHINGTDWVMAELEEFSKPECPITVRSEW